MVKSVLPPEGAVTSARILPARRLISTRSLPWDAIISSRLSRVRGLTSRVEFPRLMRALLLNPVETRAAFSIRCPTLAGTQAEAPGALISTVPDSSLTSASWAPKRETRAQNKRPVTIFFIAILHALFSFFKMT
jgi:hypothetical protein